MPDFQPYVRERLRALSVRPEREAAIVEELSQQLASAYEDALSGGASEEAALSAAYRQIKDWRQLTMQIQEAERPPAPEIPNDGRMFRGFWHDIHYAARMLRRSPGFAAACILTLALGIGGCTAMFSLLDAIVLRPLEYRDPDRLMVVWEHFFTRGNKENVVAPANFLDWKKRTNIFSSMSAIGGTRRNLTGLGEPEELDVQLVQQEYFPMLGIVPIQGRLFTADEDKPDAPRPVLLGHQFWMRKFQGDGSIVGKSINLSGMPYNVVGILPANFLSLGKPADVYSTLQLNPARNYREEAGRYLRAVARLRDGVTQEQAQRDLSALAAQLEIEYPRFNKNWGVNIVPMQAQFSSTVSLALWILMGAVGTVLLIACANVANLLLARSVQREREFAIRASLGADRVRMIRQLMTESLLLAFTGSALGCAFAYAIIQAFQRFGPIAVPRLESAGLDLRVLGVTLLFCVLTAVISGLAPALISTRIGLAGSLKEGGRGIVGGKHTALRTIVIAEVALAVILLAGAGLLLRSFQNTLAVHPGFDPSNVLTMSVSLPGSRYREDAKITAYYRDLNERIRQLPAVASASSVTFLPFTGPASATRFSVVGRPEPAPGQAPTTDVRIVQPRYFDTMRIPLLKGRDFTEADNVKEAPLRFIINETMATTMFPDVDPIGQKIMVAMQNSNPGEIIGVVGNIKHYGLQEAARAMVYYPQAQLAFGFASLVIRTQVDPASLTQPVLAIIRAIDPEQPVSDVRTMSDWIGRSVRQDRFLAILLASFAGLAVLLAVIGIYGVLSFSVRQRTHEIGIRLALGAVPSEVRWWIVKHGLTLAAIGLTLGLAGAAATNELLKKLVFGVEVRDPLTMAAAAVLLVSAVAAASWVPARRATRVDPMEALRYE